jgi:acetylornithine deacetylase
MDDRQRRVLDELDEGELQRMMEQLIELPSPTGEEGPVGDYLAARFAELGLAVELQEVEAGRNNVIARWPLSDPGPSVLLLGHMDSAPGIGRPTPKLLDGGWIAGLGASNMKSAFPCYWMALQMLRAAGVRLHGELTVAGVVGEIERAPVGTHQGAGMRGSGHGARFLGSHGLMPDFVINGEPTGLRVQTANCGYMFVRLTTRGVTQHSAYRRLGVDAIAAMERVLPRIRAWEAEYQRLFPHPLIQPNVNVGAIEAGSPPTPSLVANRCDAYVNVMLLPNADVRAVRRELDGLVAELNAADSELRLEASVYMLGRGYEVEHDAELPNVIRAAHTLATGAEAVEPDAERYGVSSDNWVFADLGAQGICYGPAGISRTTPGAYAAYDPEFGEVVRIDDLVSATQVYALSILDLLGATADESK